MAANHQLTRSRGFSLIEALFVVFLSSLVGYVLFASTRSGNDHLDTQETRMALQDSGRESLYKMVQELRESAPTRITITAGNQIQFSVPDPNALVNADYTLNWNGAHTIRYQRGGNNNTQIIRTDLTTNQSSVIANYVSTVSFTGNLASPTVVTITLGMQRQTSQGRLIPATPLQLTAQAKIRNR